MKHRLFLLACVCLLNVASLSRAQEPWAASAQPDLAEKLAAAKKLNVINVVEPVHSTRLDMTYLVPTDGDKKNWHMLQFYFKPQVATTVVIANLADGTMKQVQTDRYVGYHMASDVFTRGKFFIGNSGDHGHGEVSIYDPAKGDFKVNAVKMPDELRGETHPMILGMDGNLYMAGGHPNGCATVAKINPETLEVTSYGALGPSQAPTNCWATSLAVDDTHIYIASGKVPYYLLAYEFKTGKTDVLFTTERESGYVVVRYTGRGVTAKVVSAVGDHGESREYFLYQGKAIPNTERKQTPPWPETDAVNEREVRKKAMLDKPEFSLASAVPDIEGNATIWYRLPANRPAEKTVDKAAEKTAEKKSADKQTNDKKPADEKKSANAKKPESPAKAVTESEDDEASEVVDESKMQAEGWKPLHFKVPLYPMPTYRLTELPDGRLFGTAGAYTGMFLLDPKTGKPEHPGLIHMSHYATIMNKGIIYMSGYPSAPLFVYDPSKPWTTGTRISATKLLEDTDPKANPRRVTNFTDSGCHKMYAGAIGADGTVYMGGRWYRDGNHGGIGWWNPATNETGGLWRDLSNYQLGYMVAVDGGKTLVISATRVEDLVLRKPKPEQGALFFFDHASKKIVGTLEVLPKIKGPGPIVAVGPNRVLGWTENTSDTTGNTSVLYGVNTESRTVSFTKIVPSPVSLKISGNQQDKSDYRLGPDGWVWTFMAGSLVRINPANADIQVLGKVDNGGRIAFSGKNIFLAGETSIHRIDGVVP